MLPIGCLIVFAFVGSIMSVRFFLVVCFHAMYFGFLTSTGKTYYTVLVNGPEIGHWCTLTIYELVIDCEVNLLVRCRKLEHSVRQVALTLFVFMFHNS